MAQNVFFKKGLLANLPASYSAGTFYVTTDERAMYLDIDDSTRIRLGDFIQVDAVANLPTAGASTSALYYCVAENILAKWNGTTWTQINKQPTAEEMKTLLGLGTMAYKSEVAEGDLNTDLATKINAASGAQHTHANKDLLDTYTQTEANLADAVAKKHAHTFVESELNKIADGDVAKWNAVVADHLDSEDETALKNLIKEAKQAGTDANTNIESYKITNDARVLAVEEDIAEIVDGDNGILAQAKSYTDGKDSAMNTRVAALETAAPTHALKTEVEAVDAKFANYNTTVAQKAIDDAQDAEIVKKVDKVEGKSLIADSEIARLATLANYDDTQVKADIAKKADAEATTAALNKKVDKVDGYSLVADTEIARLAEVDNYDDTALAGRVTEAEGKITALEGASATHATKSELADVDAKFANYKTAEAQKAIDDEQDRRLGVIEGDYLKAADIANFETKENVKKVADDLAAYVESNDEALAGVKATAEAARTEDEVNSQIDAKITALNLATTYEPIGAETRAKAYADGLITDANLDQYTTEQEVKDIVDAVVAGAVDGDTLTGLANFVEYFHTHGGEAAEMGAAIDVLEGKVETIEGKPAYGITATQISNWDGEVGAKALAETKLDASTFTEYSNAHASDYTNKQIDDAIDADVKAAIDAEVLRANGAYDAKGAAADAQAAAEATAAGALATARTEITAEIGTAISGEVSRADAKYEEKGVAQGIVDALKLSETYEPIGAETRAIAAAKTETETQVKALADGQVTTNKNDIANIVAQLTWGEF